MAKPAVVRVRGLGFPVDRLLDHALPTLLDTGELMLYLINREILYVWCIIHKVKKNKYCECRNFRAVHIFA